MLWYTFYWLKQDLCLLSYLVFISSQQEKSPHRRLISVLEGEFCKVLNHQLNILEVKHFLFSSLSRINHIASASHGMKCSLNHGSRRELEIIAPINNVNIIFYNTGDIL